MKIGLFRFVRSAAESILTVDSPETQGQSMTEMIASINSTPRGWFEFQGNKMSKVSRVGFS
jgi:hypothetical protein